MKNKKQFTILFCLFLLFSVGVPIAYLCIRFNLFKDKTLAISMGGILVFGILLAVLGVMIKYYLDGMKTKYSFLKKILQGTLKVILPLALLTFIMVYIGDNITFIKEALFIITPCEALAVIINPLPKWCFDNNIDGLAKISDKIFKRG